MKIIEEALNGVKLLQPNILEDERGYFYESYNINTFASLGINDTFIQDNQSLSKSPFVLRGIHFQNPPFAQAKLVRVVKGAVYDVALDLRKNSPSFGQWFGAKLTETNKINMYIPEGFAHGFLTLEPNTIFNYKCSNVYNRESEEGIAWNDPELGIDWNIEAPVLSEKDTKNQLFKDYKSQF